MRYALAEPATTYTLRAQAVDRDAELAADLKRPRSLAPRYAVTRAIQARHVHNQTLGGEWRELGDGMALWRVPVAADNATSLAFSFSRFFLPPGAQMYLRNNSQTLGPYTDADNPRSLQFATPLIRGDHAVIEVLVPRSMKSALDLELAAVHAGYRDILTPDSLRNPEFASGACNVDTICPQGDPWRREINAVAVLISASTYCSGQLVNNTLNDRAPLLATAAHCFDTQWAASNLVVYWKYESPVCREPGSDASGQPVPTDNAIAQTGGAQLLGTHVESDFTLLKLNTQPPANANVYFNGWDRTESTFGGAVVIHHPRSDAKRISIAAGLVTLNNDTHTGQGIYHWRVDHYSQGTTEPGSSGSGLLDGNHRLRGVLSNGATACNVPQGDANFGRLSTAWQGGGTAATRVAEWLDPAGSGATQIDGLAGCTLPGTTLDLSANSIGAGDKITLTAGTSGGAAPYTYAFDVDGDGLPDSTDPSQASISAVYPTGWSGNVSVKVVDSAGCVGTASRALIVQAPHVALAAAPPAPQALCGTSPGTINPGQRWRTQVNLVNNSTVASQAGYAVFAQDAATLNQSKLTVETPAVAVPALASGQTVTIDLDYAVDAQNVCGAPIKINLVGTTDGRSFTPSSASVVDTKVSVNCQAITTCPAQTTPLKLDSGSYYDTLRGGNGISVTNILQSGADPVVFGVWFTGDAARQPTWYTTQAALHANQVNSPVYRGRLTAPSNWPITTSIVGGAQLTLIDSNKFIYSWSLDGKAGGGLFTPLTLQPSKVRLWYNSKESGWGSYDQLAQINGPAAQPLMFNAVYLYDASGAPRWLVGVNPAYADGAPINAIASRPTCPGCVWLDPNAGKQDAGSLFYTIDGSNAQISTNLSLPSAVGGTWIRSQLPLSPLYLSP
ncbi:MAG: trypsin-like peptidase domain-containing protein [Rudaea sp.]|uniref:trypsin-like serine peptidase n=1 Tax=unclassified Rudaea TaxID=2627037 RepID=UPI00148562E2|nr:MULTISPECIES: trypsin-like peptidase domain-containing protein [unclassified Rudaea]MBR0344713.1 trypsin-like peptidase domain-containing protein [Rudaea sp.]